jgi:hypothetical protein
MNYTTSSRYAVPQSFITKSKQRLKQHIDTVYLNNGDEFEIELYNPTSNKVLAKIELNGKSIGNGIILRPGERVFLERYLDEAKKFLFETYVVNGNNQEVKNAIANNGDVVVKFYDETFFNQYNSTLTVGAPYPWWSTTGTALNYPPGVRTFTTNNPNTYFTNTSGISGTFDGTITTSNYSYTSNSIVNDSNVNYTKPKTSEIRHVETGRVEKGSDSNQSFTFDNTSFNSYPCKTNWWKLKPVSTKVLVKEDLVVYCTECGSKRKKDNHKFCPHCGTKF